MKRTNYKTQKAYFRGNPKYGRATQLVFTPTNRIVLETMGISTLSEMIKQYNDSLSKQK